MCSGRQEHWRKNFLNVLLEFSGFLKEPMWLYPRAICIGIHDGQLVGGSIFGDWVGNLGSAAVTCSAFQYWFAHLQEGEKKHKQRNQKAMQSELIVPYSFTHIINSVLVSAIQILLYQNWNPSFYVITEFLSGGIIAAQPNIHRAINLTSEAGFLGWGYPWNLCMFAIKCLQPAYCIDCWGDRAVIMNMYGLASCWMMFHPCHNVPSPHSAVCHHL